MVMHCFLDYYQLLPAFKVKIGTPWLVFALRQAYYGHALFP